MKQRNPIAVVLLTIFTFGIYGIVWSVKTKNEMNARGANIPTAWLLIVPFVNIWWLWKYSEGVEHITGGKTSTILAFVLQFLLGVIGMAIIQYEFNKIGSEPAAIAADSTTEAAPGFGGEETATPVAATTVETAPTAPTAPSAPAVAPSAPEVSASPAAHEASATPSTDAPAVAETPAAPEDQPKQV